MMSLATIRAESDSAARAAAKKKLKPYVFFDSEEVDLLVKFPFPNIGSLKPKGWKIYETLFCDHSGWGMVGESALTVDQLRSKIKEILERPGTWGFAITEVGQFQLCVGVFKKVERKK